MTEILLISWPWSSKIAARGVYYVNRHNNVQMIDGCNKSSRCWRRITCRQLHSSHRITVITCDEHSKTYRILMLRAEEQAFTRFTAYHLHGMVFGEHGVSLVRRSLAYLSRPLHRGCVCACMCMLCVIYNKCIHGELVT